MDNYQITSYSGAEIEALLDKIDDLGNASQSTAGLMSASDKTKLDGLDSGAQANVLEGVKIAGADLPITEKKVNIPADSSPTSGSNSLVRSGGVFNAIKDFITRSVNDLVNYYTKSDTYTKTEVNNIIGSLNQFHYEIYASTSAVTNPQPNVLYLIGPTGTGSDKYEEYVYSNGWVKIGDTTIDLSGYSTTEQMNAAINNALKDYATKEEVSQLGQKQDTFLPDTILAINPSVCVNSGFINQDKTVSPNLNYGYSNAIHILAGQRIRIQGVGTGMPYFAYCTSDGTITGVSTNSSGITSVYENIFNEESYIRVNGRIVPDSNGNYVLGGIFAEGLSISEVTSAVKYNIKKYVSVRGATYRYVNNTVRVTLNTLFIQDYKGGRAASISDSNEYILGSGNNILVITGNNTIALRLTSAYVLATDYILLFFDTTLKDITGGVLYADYLCTRIVSAENKLQFFVPSCCINVNHINNHPAAYRDKESARRAVPAEYRIKGAKLV